MSPIFAIVLALVAGAAVGGLASWAISAARYIAAFHHEKTRLASQIATLEERVSATDAAHHQEMGAANSREKKLEVEIQTHRERTSQAERESARLQAELQQEKMKTEEKLGLLQSAEKALRDAFKALSADALSANSTSFIELANEKLTTFQKSAAEDMERRQKNIEDTVKPLQEKLKEVDTTLRSIEKERAGTHGELTAQLRSLATSEKELRGETANLVKALRSPTVRGRWGEMQLRRVIEMAEMLNHCDFKEQQTAETEEGSLRPDVIVQLPGGKTVVVDAKVSIMAYLEAVSTSDEDVRARCLREHTKQVRDHITKLGSKSYWDQFQPSPEFVIMFMPGEGVFRSALEQDPGLIEHGVAEKVLPASPLTLIALLRAVAYGWQQERLAESAQAISNLGRTLYERLATMGRHFGGVGKALDTSVRAYNDAVASFEGRVLVAARRFKNLGVTSSDELQTVTPVDRSVRFPRAITDGPLEETEEEIEEQLPPPETGDSEEK